MKKKYFAPSMTELDIELECGFMAGSVIQKDKGLDIKSAEQDYEEIDFSTDEGNKLTWE